MKKRVFALLGLALIFAVAAPAHGDKKHVMGTIEKINADSIVVKTGDGKSVEVKLVSSTTYISHNGTQDKPAKLSDLAVGNRVVIHATPSGDTLSADEVKFSPASASHSSGRAAKP